MTVDERLRAAMRAHDAEAPTRVPWPVAPATAPVRRRPPTRVLLVAAVLAVLVAAGTLLAVVWPRPARTAAPTAPTALSCPSHAPRGASGVPSAPTVPGADSRMVPRSAPDAVLVCGYATPGLRDPASPGPNPISGSLALTGDLTTVVDSLTDLPRGTADHTPCPAYLTATDDDDYLVGLRYPDGTVWVSAPGGHCAGSGNGVFTSPTHLSGYASGALQDGRWPEAPTAGGSGPRCARSDGRLGGDTVMVPGDPVSLTVCPAPPDTTTTPVTVPSARIAAFVAAADGPPAAPVAGTCRASAAGQEHTLVFGYATGPTVVVVVQADCTRGVTNGTVQAVPSPALLTLVHDLFA